MFEGCGKMIRWLVLLAVCLLLWPAARAEEERVLRVFAWPDTLNPAVVRDFSIATRTRVEITPCPSNEAVLAALRDHPTRFDVVFPSDWLMPILLRDELLTPLDGGKLVRLGHVDPRFNFPAGSLEARFAAPFRWGATGIVVRAGSGPFPRSWKDLFNATAPWAGRVGLVGDMREALGAALMALGYTPNSSDAREISAAGELIQRHQKTISSLDSRGWDEALIQGQLGVAQGWSDRVQARRAQGDPLRFIYPREGGLLWTDVVAVPRQAPQVELALHFVDHLLSGRQAARSVAYTGLPTTNQAAKLFLAPQLGLPKKSEQEHLVRLRDVGRSQRHYEAAWQDVLYSRRGEL